MLCGCTRAAWQKHSLHIDVLTLVPDAFSHPSRSRNLVSVFLREMPGAISDLLMRRMANRMGQDSPVFFGIRVMQVYLGPCKAWCVLTVTRFRSGRSKRGDTHKRVLLGPHMIQWFQITGENGYKITTDKMLT